VLFTQVCDVIGLIAGRKRVGLFCEVAKNVPRLVSADSERIGITLLRLAEGVIAAMDGSDLCLSLKTVDLQDGFELTFEIVMPGKMLPAVMLGALHEEGLEFDSSSSASGALRLAATRQLAIMAGGRVEASADASTGTWIGVRIPVGSPSGVLSSAGASSGLLQGSQRALRILIAEDSDESFQLFRAYLQDQPHIVSRAHNGAKAVEIATTQTFDLVFMDVRMPIIDGYEASKRIREWETGKDCPRVPIVVLSAEDLRVQRRRGALVGCSAHLSKPLRKQDLLEAIKAFSKPEFSEAISPVLAPNQ
jgi:CheY-like chemotaxis protein